jgi:hypothetical protein
MHEGMNLLRVPGLGLAPAMASRDQKARRPDALLDDALVGDEIRAAGEFGAAAAIGTAARREARRLELFRGRQRPAWTAR